MLKPIPSLVLAASLLGAATLVMQPAQAASLDLSTWDIIGDGVKAPSTATITNAFSDGNDDLTNLNLSGSNPVNPVDSLEAALGLQAGDLGPAAQEGSGIYTTLLVGVGDVLSFNWAIPVNNESSGNRAFAAIAGQIFDLDIAPNTSSPFSYTFNTSGSVRVGVGIVDLGDTLDSAQLQISNVDFTPVPSPAMLPGLIGVGLGMLRKRKQQSVQ